MDTLRDELADRQRRLDEQVSAMLNETVSSHHSMKRIRRMLEVETSGPSALRISLEDYDNYMRDLCDQQLKFESFRRMAALIQHRLPGAQLIPLEVPVAEGEGMDARLRDLQSGTLEDLFQGVEHYLNYIVEEYQKNRWRVEESQSLPLADLTKLREFVLETEKFKAGASDAIDTIVNRLAESLLRPVRAEEPLESAKRS